MLKNILSALITFFVLLAFLFVGMFIGGDDFAFFQKSGEEVEKEKEVYEPFLEHEKRVIEVVEENIPAVVNVVVSKHVEYLEFPRGGLFFFEGEPETREREETEEGTGFIISEDGLILTNKHVVKDENADYTVFLSGGEKFEAEVLARDPMQDIAVLKIEGDEFPTVRIGDSDTVRLGQTAIAIGNALGEFQNTVSTGVISGTGRRIVARGGYTVEVLDDVLQTDAAINFGNSGGPLLNIKGEVIGINTATMMYAEGIGFAIPINRAERAIKGAMENGRIVYPFLGVHYLIVNEEIQKKENLPVDYGAMVSSGVEGEGAVVPDSAAERAGIKEGDIILELEGEKITVENSLARIITRYNPQDEVELKILRGEREMNVKATLGEIE